MFRDFPVSIILRELEQDSLLPAILFRTSRKQCDQDVEKLASLDKAALEPSIQTSLKRAIAAICEKYSIEQAVVEQHPHYPILLRTGVGAHHAGQLLVWRLVLEELMSAGTLKLLIATGTVAAGVDFPARTVVVTAHSKRGTEGFNVLSPSEFQQMSGRAGRRGKDTVGICLIAPGSYCDARVIRSVAKTPPEPLTSAYFAAPSTVLNLLKYRNVDDLRYTVSRSLASFLDRKSAKGIREQAAIVAKEAEAIETDERRKKTEKKSRRLYREADTLEGRQIAALEQSLRGLERLGHVEGGVLTAKGVWAAELCTSLVLELAEAIADHLFADCVLEELVGLVASIAGDSYRDYFSLRKNPISNDAFARLQSHVDTVTGLYEGSPFANEVKVQKDAAVTVLTWMESQTWNEFASLLRLAGVAEGDAARLIMQTADHLNQFTRLSESHPDLARMAGEARSLLLRPPITDTYEVG